MVAQIVHRLGFPVSAFIPAPGPPSWRSDWEDANLTMRLMLGLDVNWAGYVDERRKLSHAMGFEGRVAIKSPYLALHRKALDEALGDPQWIFCTRDEEDVARSMLAHPQLKLSDQAKIKRALDRFEETFFQFDYDFALRYPLESVGALAMHLELDDAEAVHAAAALIGSPTEYPCLQSN